MCVRSLRFPFWLMISIAITFLFTGNATNILTRIQHNWIGSLIIVGVSFFFNGRFGFVKNSSSIQRSMSNRVSIALRVLGIAIFAFGILIEIFLYFLPRFVVFPLGMICSLIAPACIYFSYSFTSEEGTVNRES